MGKWSENTFWGKLPDQAAKLSKYAHVVVCIETAMCVNNVVVILL